MSRLKIPLYIVAVLIFSGTSVKAVPTPEQNAELLERLTKTVDELRKTVEAQKRMIWNLSERLTKEDKEPAVDEGIIPEELSMQIEQALRDEQGENALREKSTGPGNGYQFQLPVPRMLQGLNPDISAVGDIVYDLSDNSNQVNRAVHEGGDRLNLREFELGFQSAVDPYVRGAAYIGFHGDHVDVEEAYAQSLSLPFGLQAKGGRFFADFGKLNKVHTHDLPQVDRPLVLTSFFGEENFGGDGFGMSWLVPNPWDQYVNLTAQVLNGFNRGHAEEDDHAGESTLEGLSHYSNLLYLARASTYHDITENQNIETGISGFTVDDRDGYQSLVGGVDATYRWKPLRRSLYQQFLARTELLGGKNETPDGTQNPWGMYAYGEYQFARGLSTGLRFDYTQLFENDGIDERGLGPYVTWWPSEFFRLRLQYQHLTSDAVPHEDRVYLQGTFVMGAHGAHQF